MQSVLNFVDICILVPNPSMAISPPNIQIVGQSLTLQCEVTAVRGIISSVDIVWSSGGMELERMKNINHLKNINNSTYINNSTKTKCLSHKRGRGMCIMRL